MITVGVVTPHAVAGFDVELRDLAGDQVETRVARVVATEGRGDACPPTSAEGLRALTRPAVMDEAVARLDPGTLDVLVYASTSSAYAVGPADERDLVVRLRERWSVPVASTAAAAVEALRRFDVRRLALVHPPWFGADRAALGTAYFEEQGFSVVRAGLADVPHDPELVESHHVVEWVSTYVDLDVDAVFLGGNGFRAARAVPVLEARLGCLVLESNHVLVWSVLSETDTSLDLHGCGTLFDTPTTSVASGPADR